MIAMYVCSDNIATTNVISR